MPLSFVIQPSAASGTREMLLSCVGVGSVEHQWVIQSWLPDKVTHCWSSVTLNNAISGGGGCESHQVAPGVLLCFGSQLCSSRMF